MTTPNGDKIVFGEAADSEDQASRRRGRRDAAQDAMRLYYRVYDLFPDFTARRRRTLSRRRYPLADRALRRADAAFRPRARFLHARPDRRAMDEAGHEEIPGTKWADLAAFHLIENKLCGDWQGASKCPDKEADMYEKYAKEHEQSPSAPEALYDAAWRRSALIEIYKTEANQKKSEESKTRALGSGAKDRHQVCAKRLVPARPEPDLLHAARRPDVRQRQRLIFSA